MANQNPPQDSSKDKKKPKPIPQDIYALMGEDTAADFCNLTQRTMQNFRLKGTGPEFIKIGARCIRYRKVDLIVWQESLLRRSTSDSGSRELKKILGRPCNKYKSSEVARD